MTNNLGKAEREAIVSKVMTTVEMKHYDPHFAKDRWRALVEERRADIIASGDSADFESSLADLVRSVGTPDSGFFHESTRKKVPKGLAARFQYCQPNECAPAYTQPSDAGDVLISKLADGVGWLKVTKFPGAVGVDIAKQIDRAIQELKGCDRLIIDLRGNAGGGLAFLRVMSYLTPERLPVGYSVTRARAETNYSKETLATFDRIPSQKAALILLALKFGFRDDSVSIVTEGLGAKPFHGRTVLLVDRKHHRRRRTDRGVCTRAQACPGSRGANRRPADLLQRLQDLARLLRADSGQSLVHLAGRTARRQGGSARLQRSERVTGIP